MIWEIDVVCSDPGCREEEFQVWAEDLDAVEAAVCGCGHSVVTLRVATLRARAARPTHPRRPQLAAA